MPIKLFNKGKRLIKGVTPDPSGATYVDEKDMNPATRVKPVMLPWVLAPQSALEFTDELGAKLRKMYPRELLSLEDVKSQFDATHAKTAGAKINPVPEKGGHELVDVTGLPDDEAQAALDAIIALRAKKIAEAEEAKKKDEESAEDKKKAEDDPEKKGGLMDMLRTAVGVPKEGAEDSGDAKVSNEHMD